MANSKNEIPEELKKKCHIIIHIASAACTGAGAIPIPVADTVPITATQIAMIVKLGKVFNISISKSIAEQIIKLGLAQQTGRYIFKGMFKYIPGPAQIAGSIAAGTTAAAVTEVLGWVVAEEFYKLSMGDEVYTLNDDDLRRIADLFRKRRK